MDAARYERLQALFAGARTRPDEERAAWLAEHCDDESLRDEVLELLTADTSGRFSDAGLAAERARRESALDALDHDASRQATTQPGWMPERVGEFRVLRLLGQGGMGVVYEAEQDQPHRRVALKLVHPVLADAQAVRRLEREAEILARLQHPGIAQVYATGSEDVGLGRQPWVAMELVDGTDLRTYADQHDLDVRARLALMAKVADAVHHAHERGVVHRDLKPENVLVDASGKPKVLDFGVARASDTTALLGSMTTASGALMGTLAYMAPEQLDPRRGVVGPWSDVYALGVVAFELLAGQRPHDVAGLSLSGAIRSITQGDPPALRGLVPGAPVDAETIVSAALAPEIDRRYPSAAALADDVRRFLGDLPLTARPPSLGDTARRFVRRHRGLVAGTLATLLALLAGTVVAIDFAMDEQAQRELAEGQRLLADAQREVAEQRAWRASIAVASESLSRGDIRGSLAHLTAARAYPGSGWELALLEAATRRHDLRLPAGAVAAAVGRRFAGPVALDPSGRHVVAALSDGQLVAWDLTAGRELRRVALDGGARLVASAMPDGEAWVLDGAQRLLRWDPRSGARTPVADLSGHGELTRLHVSDDGRRALATGAAVLLVEDGEVHVLGRRGTLSALPFTESMLASDGRRALVAESVNWNAQFLVFDLDRRARESETRSGGVSVASASRDLANSLCVFEGVGLQLRTGDVITDLEQHHDGAVVATAFSDDGRFAASAGEFDIAVWDVGTARLISSWSHAGLGSDPVHGLRFTRDGAALVGLKGSQLVRWPFEPTRELLAPRWSLDTGDYSYQAAFSADGSWVATRAVRAGALQVVDTRTGQPVVTTSAPLGTGEPAQPFAFAADRTRLLVNPEGPWTSVLDLAGGVHERHLRPLSAPDVPWHDINAVLGRDIVQLGIGNGSSADGRVQASVRPNGWPFRRRDPNHRWQADTVTLWDGPSGSLRTLQVPDGQLARGSSVRPDGERVALALASGGVVVLDRASGAPLDGQDAAHGGSAWGVAYSPDGRRLASSGNDGRVLIWDAEDLASGPLLSLRGADSYTYGVAWSPDGTRLLATTGHGDVHIWDSVGREERRLEAAADDAAWARGDEPTTFASAAARRHEAERIRAADDLEPTERRARLTELVRLGLPEGFPPKVLGAPTRPAEAWLVESAQLLADGLLTELPDRLAQVADAERDWAWRHLAAQAARQCDETLRGGGFVETAEGVARVLAFDRRLVLESPRDGSRRTLIEVQPPAVLGHWELRGRQAAVIRYAPDEPFQLIALDIERGGELWRQEGWGGYTEVSPVEPVVLLLWPGQGLTCHDADGVRWEHPFDESGGGYGRFTPDGQRVVLQELRQDGLSVSFLDARSGEPVGPSRDFPGQAFQGLADVLPDGRTLAVGLSDGRLLELDLADMSVRAEHRVAQFGFGGFTVSADGRWLHALCLDEGDQLIDRETGAVRRIADRRPRWYWTRGRGGLSPDGRWLALESLLVDLHALQPRVTSADAKEAAPVLGPTQPGRVLAHPRDDVGVRRDEDGALRLVRPSDGVELYALAGAPAEPRAWGWSADGHELHVRAADGRVAIWHDHDPVDVDG